jgi:glycosyltransferase involved in cell wall biosynthesis
VDVTIGIKALNEERHIAKAIEAALDGLKGLSGEVILADSCSTDRTTEIASGYPIRVVQLANASERRCGAGAQLAFQHARGDYFYMLDGDMVLHEGFIAAAKSFLDANPEVAAAGGRVREMNIDNAEFQIRAKALASDPNRRPGIVEWLDGGGLYRTKALREVGWFADRNLHGFEELELGARLRARGWKSARIDHDAVDHYGHQEESYKLLLRRFRSGYAGAAGEALRAALGRPHLGIVLRRLPQIRVSVIVTLWWLALAATLFSGLWTALLALLALPVAFLSWRRRSLRLGMFSLVSWNIGTFAFYLGMLSRRAPPDRPLASRVLAPENARADRTEHAAE